VLELLKYDVAIPITKPTLVHDICKLCDLDIAAIEPMYDEEELAEPFRVKLPLEFATAETELDQAEIAVGDLPVAE
jgi:type III restriction enzyme